MERRKRNSKKPTETASDKKIVKKCKKGERAQTGEREKKKSRVKINVCRCVFFVCSFFGSVTSRQNKAIKIINWEQQTAQGKITRAHVVRNQQQDDFVVFTENKRFHFRALFVSVGFMRTNNIEHQTGNNIKRFVYRRFTLADPSSTCGLVHSNVW